MNLKNKQTLKKYSAFLKEKNVLELVKENIRGFYFIDCVDFGNTVSLLFKNPSDKESKIIVKAEKDGISIIKYERDLVTVIYTDGKEKEVTTLYEFRDNGILLTKDVKTYNNEHDLTRLTSDTFAFPYGKISFLFGDVIQKKGEPTFEEMVLVSDLLRKRDEGEFISNTSNIECNLFIDVSKGLSVFVNDEDFTRCYRDMTGKDLISRIRSSFYGEGAKDKQVSVEGFSLFEHLEYIESLDELLGKSRIINKGNKNK